MAIHCVYVFVESGAWFGGYCRWEWVWESWWLRDTPLVNEIEQVFSFCSESRDRAWGEKGAACGACCAVPCYALKKWLLIGSFFVLIAEKPSCLLFCLFMNELVNKETNFVAQPLSDLASLISRPGRQKFVTVFLEQSANDTEVSTDLSHQSKH